MANISGLTRTHLPPYSIDDAGKYLKIDANGNPIYFTETPGGVVDEAGANAANDIGDATGATTALKLANLTSNASTTQEGVSEFATAAEIVTGTDDTRATNVKQLKDSLALDSMWLTKRTKMPDGATAVYSQDAWATVDGFAKYPAGATLDVTTVPGALHLVSDGSAYTSATKTIAGASGKTLWLRYRANRAVTLFNDSILTVWATLPVSTAFTVIALPVRVDLPANKFIFGWAASTAGDYFDLKAIWIGDYSYLPGSLSEEAARIANQLGDAPGVGVAASGTITSNGTAPSDGDTVTIAGKVYTFKTVLGTTEGQVLIGANAAEALDNLKAAVNSTGVSAVQYCAAAHPLVEATTNTDTVQTLAARSTGELGNSITLAKSAATLTLSGSTLTGGYSDAAAKASNAVANASQGLTAKTSAVAADYELLLDSADGFKKKKVLKSNLESTTQAAGKRALYNAAAGLNANSISFPAAQVASSDANTLDDYEEGTFTPTIIGNTAIGAQTYATQTGRYTKIGRQVTCSAFVEITAKDVAMAGNVLIGGLPFTSEISNVAAAIGLLKGITFESGRTQIVLYTALSQAFLRVATVGSATTDIAVPTTSIANATYISFSITYSV